MAVTRSYSLQSGTASGGTRGAPIAPRKVKKSKKKKKRAGK